MSLAIRINNEIVVLRVMEREYARAAREQYTLWKTSPNHNSEYFKLWMENYWRGKMTQEFAERLEEIMENHEPH